ncbi:MAG: hypothetical protein QM726_12885 [Chitinophagaceae bacterium]
MTQIIKTFLPAVALLITSVLQAQTNVTNTGGLSISNTGSLYITGSLSNTATANLANAGSLHVQQGLTNAQAFATPGTGTLYLDGVALQTISGTQAFSTFNLVTNNPAGIMLNNDLNISGVHTFTAGIINTDAVPHYLRYQSGASYTGYADARHVNGWVSKAGNTNFTFPLGNGTLQRPLAITNISGLSVFNATYPGPTFNTSSIAAPLSTINLNEYWNMTKTSGGTAEVDLYWDNAKVPFPQYILADMRVAGNIGASWITLGGSATGNVATTGSIHSNPLSVFGPLTIGSISFALPVTIIQFSGYAGTGGNILSWTTTEEINVSHYDLQRSDDGISFYSIGNTPAQNTAGTHQYQYTDSKPMRAFAYYRLKSVDKDGQYKLSKVIIITATTVTKELYAVNPVHGQVELQVQRITGVLQYKISTLSGQVVQSGKINVVLPGRYKIALQSAVAHGVYILQLEKTGFAFTQRLLVD